MNCLWEILVPCQWNSGKPIRTKHHKNWDKKVRNISKGLTIMTPAKGQWIYNNQLYEERVIPVRISCTRKDIEKIMDFTALHYRQLAVLCYKLSDEVIYKEYE